MPFIFNYADVSPKEMQKVLLYSLPAILKHHALEFRGFSRRWASSVASVVKQRGSQVNGSVALIAEKDLGVVDRMFPLYKREKISFEIPLTGDVFSGWVYLLDASSPASRPTEEYLICIVKHLKMFWSGDLDPDSLYIPPLPPPPPITENSVTTEVPISSTSLETSVKVETESKETSPSRKRGRPRKDIKK